MERTTAQKEKDLENTVLVYCSTYDDAKALKQVLKNNGSSVKSGNDQWPHFKSTIEKADGTKIQVLIAWFYSECSTDVGILFGKCAGMANHLFHLGTCVGWEGRFQIGDIAICSEAIMIDTELENGYKRITESSLFSPFMLDCILKDREWLKNLPNRPQESSTEYALDFILQTFAEQTDPDKALQTIKESKDYEKKALQQAMQKLSKTTG